MCALTLIGCSEPKAPKKDEAKITPVSVLEESIQKHGEIIFYGWSGRRSMEGAHFRLIFRKKQVVKIDILGYNFAAATGYYTTTDDGLIEIKFDRFDAPKDNITGYTIEWPLLRLRQEHEELLVYRDDGKTDWHIDWPLYPEVVNNVWPARTMNANAEQADAGNRLSPASDP